MVRAWLAKIWIKSKKEIKSEKETLQNILKLLNKYSQL